MALSSPKSNSVFANSICCKCLSNRLNPLTKFISVLDVATHSCTVTMRVVVFATEILPEGRIPPARVS